MMDAHRVETPVGSEAYLIPGWCSVALETLLEEIPFETHTVRMFGKTLNTPRLSSWHGDPGASYAYSGVNHDPHPWTPILTGVREQLHAQFGLSFNSVLLNYYRDGRDSIHWHSDSERELGETPVIASVSLGTPRKFCLRHNESKEQWDARLGDGSLFVMAGRTQETCKHAIPKTAKPVGPRINLTFRSIIS